MTEGLNLLESWTQIIREIQAGREEYMIYFIILNIFNFHLMKLKIQGKELATPTFLKDLLIKLRVKQQRNVNNPITQEEIDYTRNYLDTLVVTLNKLISNAKWNKLEKNFSRR